MAFNTKKIDFLAIVSGMQTPRVFSRSSSVFVVDDNNESNKVEIYRASNMQEEGLCSAMNQSSKFRNWLK